MSDEATLLATLDSSNLAEKKKAIFQIGEKRIQDAVPKILDLLREDPDPVVRNSAARALGKLNSPDLHEESFNALTHALNDTDVYVKANACWSLGKLKDSRAIPFLQNMVDPSQRVYASTGDAQTKGANVKQIANLKEEGVKFSDVIIAAIKALGELKDPDALPALAIAIEDEDDGAVRCAACLAMGKIKDKQATPHLIRALSDKYWYVRRDAAKALWKIKDPSSAAMLATKINDMYDEVRKFVMKALLALGKDAYAIIFQAYLQNPKNAELQQFIAKNFTKEDLVSTLEALIQNETDPKKKARFTAFLQKITTQ